MTKELYTNYKIVKSDPHLQDDFETSEKQLRNDVKKDFFTDLRIFIKINFQILLKSGNLFLTKSNSEL